MLSAGSFAIISSIKYTTKDYIQDGLIAIWDGIENAGYGVHDPNATVWKDLSGNGYDLTYQTGCQILDNGVLNTNTDNKSSQVIRTETDLSSKLLSLSTFTFEVCEDARSTQEFYVWSNPLIYFAKSSNSNYGYAIYMQQYYDRFVIRNIFGNGAILNIFKLHTFSGTINGGADNTYHINEVTKERIITTPSILQSDASARQFILGITNIAFCWRLYSRSLTPDEISRNYQIDKIRFKLK